MAEEVPAYGLDAELAAKAAAKYDTNAEKEATSWIEAITGSGVVGQFPEALRSGVVLCELLNRIKPGTVARVNAAGKPFKERENISNFLKACRTLGVQEHACFSTDDLYDGKNLMSVVTCIHSLGGAVQQSVPDFRGPHLGVVDASRAKRSSRRELGPATQSGGLSGAMERTHIDVSNSIVRPRATTDSAAGPRQTSGAAGAASPSAAPAKRHSFSGTAPPPARAAEAQQAPPCPASATAGDEEVPLYGLDAELAEKVAAKFDSGAENEAAQWIEAITGANVAGSFSSALRSGQVLCELVNKIKPGTVARINGDGKPFKERENISNFLKACRAFGVQEHALFSTDDLYDGKNMLSVVNCIHSLGGVTRRITPDFPHLGNVDTSNVKREQKRDLGPVTQSGGLSAAMERTHIDRSREIIADTGGAVSQDRGVSRLGMGAAGIMVRGPVEDHNA